MDKKALPIGISSYEKLISNDYYFVDKTLLIKDFLKRKTQVTLITRPRRFGKTLTMSMIAEFFDITKDSKELFKNTKIMDTPYAKEINQWPTIFISFADAKRDKESVINTIKSELQNQWDKYNFVFENLSGFKKTRYDYLYNVLADLNGDLTGINSALKFLMDQMQDYYKKGVMVFIDEYDTPFIEANVNGFYDEIKSGLSGLLHNSLKTSNGLKYAMLTGIQRVAKENVFSDLNNLIVCDVTDDRYSNYFGFTESETKDILEYYGLELNNEVKAMYDGYKIGETEIYNPWSILCYIDSQELTSYWVNTSSNKMIRDAMRNADKNFNDSYEKLVSNGYLDTTVNLQTSFYETSNTESLWGLFVNAGYLTVTKKINKKRYRIEIPNDEVREEFESLTSFYLNIEETVLDNLRQSLIDQDKNLFIENYQNILLKPSYYDLERENSYHMFLLGMCMYLENQYEVLSNHENGKGRYDITLKSKKESLPSYIIEFKYLNKEQIKENELESLANQAVQQIKDNQYDHDLTGKIIYIGLAHHGKDVLIKWEEKDQ